MRSLFGIIVSLSIAAAAGAQTSAELVSAAREALQSAKHDEATRLASQAIKADPKNIEAFSLRASIYEKIDKYADAVADLTQIIALDKTLAEIYQRRGLVNFKAGKIKES